MWFTKTVTFAALFAGLHEVSALPAEERSTHVLHEKRTTGLRGLGQWRQASRVHPDAIVPLRIGLKQNNLEAGHDLLMSISHPNSPDYGKHLTDEEVHEFFAPSAETVESVRNWLLSSGIEEVVHHDNKGWLAADIPASHAEHLFMSELYEYEDSNTGNIRMGCEEYHVPVHVQEHIDYITPGVKLSAPLRKRVEKRDRVWPQEMWQHRGPKPHPYPHPPPPPYQPHVPDDLKHCAVNITPVCYRALYGIPEGRLNNPENAPGIYEQGSFYNQKDLNSFFASYAPWVPAGTAPKLQGIDGGKAPVAVDNPYNSGEADIDFDIVISLVHPQEVIDYQVDDAKTAEAEVALDNTFNTFLDALDGSYCSYSAYGITGDSPGIDPTYPDPSQGGYKGKLQCGVYKPAQVITASYGEAENDFPQNYVERQCNEFMKLSLRGSTIIVSSSDFGVGNFFGDPKESENENGCLSGHGQNGTIFNPDYPSGCAYILTVGATQLNPGQNVYDPESALQQNLYSPGENVEYKLFSSGGGFSNFFKTPSYQAKAVANWFANHNPGYKTYSVNADASNLGIDGGRYNKIGRGYPDVSANGANLLAFVQQGLGHWYGTSLAAPIWAAVVTLINQERATHNKGPVGFINPALYENPWALNDIKNGSNPNCGSAGFHAVEGWDPVTGLGTPNYPKLVDMFLRLP